MNSSNRERPRGEPRFLADVMLGSLAKWLRILGYDVAYDHRIEDRQIIGRCRAEGRIALTRDRRLVKQRRLPNFLLIRSQRLTDQIRQVLDFMGAEVDPGHLLTRCPECNAALVPVPKEAVYHRVPVYVYRTQSRFKHCPGCQKIYWGGTHRQHIQRKLGTLRKSKRARRITEGTEEKIER